MGNKGITIIFMLWFSASWCKAQNIFIPKFTNINPVSYTDVVFTGIKDTVLVSTYSGRISMVINGEKKEKIIAAVKDEIYALAYNPANKDIAAASLESGILVINERNGKIKKRLPLLSSWSIFVGYSVSYRYLFTCDQNDRPYIWDVDNGYKELKLDNNFPKGRIIKIDENNIAVIYGKGKVIFWDLTKRAINKQLDLKLDDLSDMDGQGNYLSINFNECAKYNEGINHPEFKLIHPNWPLPNTENEKQIFDIPYHMQITAARFAGQKIYTGSIDRTVRVWDKKSGKLLSTLAGHKGSVSRIKVSKDEKQVVSIDLKGGIKFWSTE